LVSINGLDFRHFSDEQVEKRNVSRTEAGATWLDEKAGLYLIRIDLSRFKEIITLAIAHELAHVLSNHPKRNIDRIIADDEANEKGKYWGIN
jgi:predicted SprT family Zn-dependent metalloprotease